MKSIKFESKKYIRLKSIRLESIRLKSIRWGSNEASRATRRPFSAILELGTKVSAAK